MENVMLVVDDVEQNREILKVLFHKNFRIMEAESGEEALFVLEACQGHIDIMLLDLMMPGMSGFELMRRRSELDCLKNVPVVVITSSGAQEDQIRAFELGASDFIAKPFVPEIAVSRVNNVMASSRRFLSMELEKQKLKIKSEVDGMTELFNKATTEYAMNEALKAGNGKLSAMMIIDIDNFKTVNDTSGHQAGDHVLKIIANMIAGHFRKSDIIGRIGGDEFCVLMVDVPSMEIARDKANELIQVMRYKPNLAIPEYVTLSIGMASNDRLKCTYADLFRKVDAALYAAKEDGKARYREFGVEPVNLNADERPVALLLSSNRGVCSAVHALVPERVRIVEVLRFEDLEKLTAREREKVILVYADVTDLNQEAEHFWERLREVSWISMDMVFAICQEGIVAQYRAALRGGAADLFTAPIDPATFRRRTIRQIDKVCHGADKEEAGDRTLFFQE